MIFVFNIFSYTPISATDKNDFELTFNEDENCVKDVHNRDTVVSGNIDSDYENLKEIMHIDKNGDIIIRRFRIHINSVLTDALMVFADGMVNRNSINQFILMPLMDKNYDISGTDKLKYIIEKAIPQSQAMGETNLSELAHSVNFGNVGLLIDGVNSGIIIDIKTWEHRSISTPTNEEVIQGPHEGFNEVLRCNTAIIRKSVNNSELVFETLMFGSQSRNPGSLAYINGIINDKLLDEIRRRLSDIKGDYILSVFDIEKEIEEKTNITMPQIITTERPDKVCRALIEGRAALLLNGSSHALILPSNITDIIASPEDSYLRKPYSVFIKFLRIFSVFLALLTPGIYLAITRFHTDALLINMLTAIGNERNNIPFSSLTEIIIMELSFELIKEAGIRIPGSIGSSLGIVGGLVLGQAAVSASLVSPLVIILVSVCGIASFAIPSYSLSFSFRISRFIYIFAGAYYGLFGISTVLLMQMCLLLGTKSFGVPFFVPFSPKTEKNALYKSLFRQCLGIPNPQYLKSLRKDGSREG